MNATKLISLTFLMLTTTLAACAASSEPDDEEPVSSQSDELKDNGGGTVKSIRDLENDGYTCSNWPGTTITECKKFGSPTYTCDADGRCAVLNTAPPPKPWPTIVGPIPTVVFSP